MPYRVTIPDTCDRFGCSGPEVVKIISEQLGIDRNSPDMKLPNFVNRTVMLESKKADVPGAVIEYYHVEPKWLAEGDTDTKS
jgi:hypothetical protein